jgi:hypothetical protein
MSTTAVFQSKHPHHTLWLHLEYDEHNEPQALLADLGKIGWTPSPYPPPSPLFGRATLTVGRGGSGLFGGWTPAEQSAFMRQVRATLKRHGFVGVPHQKLTLAELL